MKLVLSFLSAYTSAILMAAEIDLNSVKNTSNGDCTVETLKIAATPKVDLIAEGGLKPDLKPLVQSATARAKEIYAASTLQYVKGGIAKDLKVVATEIRRVRGLIQERFAIATSIKISRDIPDGEDAVTFYFSMDRDGHPRLLFALHHLIDPVTYWVCE